MGVVGDMQPGQWYAIARRPADYGSGSWADLPDALINISTARAFYDSGALEMVQCHEERCAEFHMMNVDKGPPATRWDMFLGDTPVVCVYLLVMRRKKPDEHRTPYFSGRSLPV